MDGCKPRSLVRKASCSTAALSPLVLDRSISFDVRVSTSGSVCPDGDPILALMIVIKGWDRQQMSTSFEIYSCQLSTPVLLL